MIFPFRWRFNGLTCYNKRYIITYVITTGMVMTTLKITTIGNSLGVILPKEVLGQMNVDKGDALYMTRTPNGIELTNYDPKVVRQMETARKVMRENREALKKLAE